MLKNRSVERRRAKRVRWAKLVNVITLLIVFCAFVATGFSDHAHYWPYIFGFWILTAVDTYVVARFATDR